VGVGTGGGGVVVGTVVMGMVVDGTGGVTEVPVLAAAFWPWAPFAIDAGGPARCIESGRKIADPTAANNSAVKRWEIVVSRLGA
jgi:hypothetical protein